MTQPATDPQSVAPIALQTTAIVCKEPVVEFAGRFELNGEPLLTTNTVFRAVPVVRPDPNQIIEGQMITIAASERQRSYLVMETKTLALAVACEASVPIQQIADVRPTLRAEAVAVSGSLDKPNYGWLISQLDRNGTWKVLTPYVAERAARPRAACEVASPSPRPGQTYPERNWLERQLREVSPDPAEGDVNTRSIATGQVLGEAYKNALRALYYRRTDLLRWEDRCHFAKRHPEQVNFDVLNQRHSRAKASLAEAEQTVRMMDAATDHPKLRALIDSVEQRLRNRQESITGRLLELERLEQHSLSKRAPSDQSINVAARSGLEADVSVREKNRNINVAPRSAMRTRAQMPSTKPRMKI